METLISHSYTSFLKFLFEHQESTEDWRFELYLEEPQISKRELVKYLIRMFENYESDVAHYSDWQIAKGLEYIFNNTFSDWVFALREGPAPLEDRIMAIQGLKTIFSQCFEKRCAPSLGHYSEEGNPLNFICYMLWDISPLAYCEDIQDKEALYQAVTEVMEYSLQLNNKACVESGLHGLGHLVMFYPRASRMIERNIRRFRRIDPRLRSYAKNAMTGCIL
ncbi:MAG: hypothetical protein KTR30_22120 [Saprospiraceae bacterium]|nr:hypothetical protein [Saprospiraceae bacterium]